MFITTYYSTKIRVKVKPDYKVMDTIAIEWVQTSDHNYLPIDRGVTADVRECEVRFVGKQEDLEAILNVYEENRMWPFLLHGFETNEHIFGEEVSYTDYIYTNIVEISSFTQRAWKVYELSVKFRMQYAPTIIGSATFPNLLNVETNIKKDLDSSIIHYRAYHNSYFFSLDQNSDSGILDVNFILPIADVKNIKKHYYSSRGNIFELTQAHMPGISNPFGSTRQTWPVEVRVLDLKEVGPWGLTHRKMTMKLAEVI